MAYAQLPNAEQTFLDSNGNPLVGGTVTLYSPGTTTLVASYKDANGVTANTNPIVLDAAGRALIFVAGPVQQLVQDSMGNTIWNEVSYPANAESSLGFTPVQQGTGVNQLSNTVKLGWNGTQLLCTIDSTNLGALTFANSLTASGLAVNGDIITNNLVQGQVLQTTPTGYLNIGAGNSDIQGPLQLYSSLVGTTFTGTYINLSGGITAAGGGAYGGNISALNFLTNGGITAPGGGNFGVGGVTAGPMVCSSLAIAGQPAVSIGSYAAKSFQYNGYQTIPNGFLIQWFTIVLPTNVLTHPVFPVVFPGACLQVMGTLGAGLGANNPLEFQIGTSLYSDTATECLLTSTTSGSFQAYFIAVGY
jgi:hypothetical protein